MTRNPLRGASALFICAAIPGFCDVKIATTYTTDGQTAEAAIYGNGNRLRYDYGKGVVLLRQCDQKKLVQIDEKNKAFLSLPIDASAAPAATKTEITDTGERKEVFGYSARHLKLVETTEGKKERTETDGWYADVPALGVCTGLDENAAKRGYPLQYTTTAYGENGKPASVISMKVTALDASPLQSTLFEVPAGYADSSAAAVQPKTAPREPGVTRVGAVAMKSKPTQKGQGAGAYEHMVAQLLEAKIDVVPIPDAPPETVETKARELQCDYVLYTELAGVDKASTGKVGGLLHHTPGLGHMTGGDPYEAHVEYRLVPVAAGAQPLAATATGKSVASFNWKSAAILATNVLPMAMAAKMFSGALNPAMMNALISGRGAGASMAQMDPLMGGISMFLKGSNQPGAANAGHTNADTAIAAALEQEGKAVIAQVKAPK